jgi:hypothetical protein
VANTEPLAWNGAVDSLAAQLQTSTEHTMQKDESLSAAESAALIAFLETLSPPPPVDQLRGKSVPEAVTRGAELFVRKNCNECHAPPLYT